DEDVRDAFALHRREHGVDVAAVDGTRVDDCDAAVADEVRPGAVKRKWARIVRNDASNARREPRDYAVCEVSVPPVRNLDGHTAQSPPLKRSGSIEIGQFKR